MDDTNTRGEEPVLTPEGPPRDRTTYGALAPTVEAILDALDATSYGGQVYEPAFRRLLRLPPRVWHVCGHLAAVYRFGSRVGAVATAECSCPSKGLCEHLLVALAGTEACR